MERKLAGSGLKPNPAAVIALQIFAFRADWQAAYNALSGSPIEFIDSVQTALSSNGTTIAVAAEVIELPLSLVSFLRTDGTGLLALGDQLEVYVSALESARSTDPVLREVAQLLSRLRVTHSQGTQTLPQVRDLIVELSGRLLSNQFPEAMAAVGRLNDLQGKFPQGSPPDDKAAVEWFAEVGAALPSLTQAVADLRRRSATAGSSAA